MTPTQLLLIACAAIPLALAGLNRLRLDLAGLVIAALLGVAQWLGAGMLGAPNTPADAAKAIAGFGQPAVITLASLFIITRCLDDLGATRAITRRLLIAGGRSEARLVLLFTAATALLSLFMNNLAAAALMLPSAIDVSRRSGVKASKLLIPVAYGSALGGVATYFTTANIIVSNLLAAASPPQAPLGVLDFTPTGGLIAIAGIIYLAVWGRRLLPARDPLPEQQVTRRTGSELEDAYHLGERMWVAHIQPGSALAGQTQYDSGIGRTLGLSLALVQRGRETFFAPSSTFRFQTGDTLYLVGREERVSQLARQGVRVGREPEGEHISPKGVMIVEALLTPHSHAAGRSLRDLHFRGRYGFTGLALLRNGRSYRTDVAGFTLAPGDALLMVGPRERLSGLRHSADFIVLEPDTGDQPVDRRRVALVVGVFALAVLASLAGAPVFLAMLAAAVLLMLAGLVSPDEVYRSMEWRAIVLIAGMYAVATAMVQTGLSAVIGGAVIAAVAPAGPLGLAAGAYLLTAALTQVMGSQVSALVAAPITISAAIGAGVNPQAIAVATAIGCSASFITPMSHPVNIMVLGPGNYRFGDFVRPGLILTAISIVMLLAGMILFWNLGTGR